MRKPNGTGYIAGPMTGLPDFNYPAFHEAARALRGQGFSIINPAEHFNGDQTLPRAEYLRAAIQAVMLCDFVVCLPGWEESAGACLEVDVACALKMPVYRYDSGTLHPMTATERPPRKISIPIGHHGW